MEIRRPLKRGSSRLGLPDIYPQDPKQKEDELTSINVKLGYSSTHLLSGNNNLDEFGTAKHANIDAFGVYFSALLSEKHRINTLKDTQKKKQLVNTKEIWYVHAKTKNAVDNWFRDLASGAKSLGQLGKRIPIFNTKEGMFGLLYESQVPLSKAVWFIKMSAVHAIALSESNAKQKKRQVPDQCQELTAALCRYLKELLNKIFEHQSQISNPLKQQNDPQSAHHQNQLHQSQQQQSSSNTISSQPSISQSSLQQRNSSKPQIQPTSMMYSASQPPSTIQQAPSSKSNSLLNHQQIPFSPSSSSSAYNNANSFSSIQQNSTANISTPNNPNTSYTNPSTPLSTANFVDDSQIVLNQWQYQIQLARYLFDEGLLDQHDFLCWLLDLIEKRKNINDLLVKFICPFVLDYVIDFTRSAVLSRRLGHVCAKRLCQAFSHHHISAKYIQEKATIMNLDHKSILELIDSFESSRASIYSEESRIQSVDRNEKFSNNNDNESFEGKSGLKNSYSLTGKHVTAYSIIDIVRSQIIENQTCLDKIGHNNSENSLYENAIYVLSSMLQIICIECPTAMVRHKIVESGKPAPLYQSSPLDLLPCLPSQLPMAESDLKIELRKCIHEAERGILIRSAMSDTRWSCDSICREQNSSKNLVDKLLNVMDLLDKHNFDRLDAVNSLDSLYTKIFPELTLSSKIKSSTQQASPEVLSTVNNNVLDQSSLSTNFHHNDKKTKHQHSSSVQDQYSNLPNNSHVSDGSQLNIVYDDYIVRLLCDWATTVHRSGEYRALVVARFLDRRQTEIQNFMRDNAKSDKHKRSNEVIKETSNETKILSENIVDSTTPSSDKSSDAIQHPFQDLLLQFLDENNSMEDNKKENPTEKKTFQNLLNLFSELIRCDVFSHYKYMCTLISRGMFCDLTSKSLDPNQAPDSNKPASVKAPESTSLLSNTLPSLSTGSLYPSLAVPSSQPPTNQFGSLLQNGKLGSNDPNTRPLSFSPLSSQATTQSQDRLGNSLLDNHIDDVDADLGKLLQDIRERDEPSDMSNLMCFSSNYLSGSNTNGRQDDQKTRDTSKLSSTFNLNDKCDVLGDKTSSSAAISNPGSCPTLSNDHNKASSSTNESICPRTQYEQRHMLYVKHFPIPEDENFLNDSNQRSILLYGFGKERDEARHPVKKFTKEIEKLLFKPKKAKSRDSSDNCRIKKLTLREGFNSDTTIEKFEALTNYDKNLVINSLSTTIMEMLSGISGGQGSNLPCLESIAFVLDLYSLASNISGLIDLLVSILEELPDIEVQLKLKCLPLANSYCQSVALCVIAMLSRFNSCVLLLSKDDLMLIFESLEKLVSHIINPGYCNTSAERVIFAYLYELYNSHSGKLNEQFSLVAQKIKQTIFAPIPNHTQNQLGPLDDWCSTFLTELLSQSQNQSIAPNHESMAKFMTPNSPMFNSAANHLSESKKIFLTDSSYMRQIQESPKYRHSFVCEAICFSANSSCTDFVNEIAIICADLKCPNLQLEWINVFRSLCCSSNISAEYRILLSRVDITQPSVMDNLATFVAVLVARRCINLNDFILKCALNSVLAPVQPSDRNAAEPGIRLTCHILLSLFAIRDIFSYSSSITSIQTRSKLQSSINPFASSVAFSPGNPKSTLSYDAIRPISGGGDIANSQKQLRLKYQSDHYLLKSACSNIKIGCLITLLKAMRLLAISASPTQDGIDALIGSGKSSKMDLDDLMKRDADGKGLDDQFVSNNAVNSLLDLVNKTSLQSMPLHQFADTILRLICSQRWLHDKCLLESDIICTTEIEKNILIDPQLEIKQSQRLLFMICYNRSPDEQSDISLDDLGSEQVTSIVKMFENLDCWSMRLSLMRLQFMFAYCKSQSSMTLNEWLDNLAKAVVEFYQKTSQEYETQADMTKTIKNESAKLRHNNNMAANATSRQSKEVQVNESFSSITQLNKVWLVEPLLERLSKPANALQGKIIKATASLMESASVRANSLPSLNQTYHSTAAASTKFKERTLSQRGSASTNPSNLASTCLLGFQPFLSLILSCLKNQDKEKEILLLSINSQLYQAIHEKVDDIAYQQSIQDGLELRLCLIGQMFETIQKSHQLTSDWATLLLLIMMNHLVDPQIDYRLFVTVLDMLSILIHCAYVADPVESREDAKKYQNLMRKFRKELLALEEKGFVQMKLINPLMPLIRQMTEVVTCEPMGSLVDTKGEKLENFYSIEKKKGLKVSEIQEVNPWDLIEGHKNPAPLSWQWFGAIKLEQKSLRAEENNKLLAWHTHPCSYPTSYFCKMPDEKLSPSGKRNANEKKPSDSNPLLKSLIEASDESSNIKKEASHPSNSQLDQVDSATDYIAYIGDDSMLIDKEDFLEDYCDIPFDTLFDSAPIETVIKDIKSAMQAEQIAASKYLVPTKPASNAAEKRMATPDVGQQPQSIVNKPLVATSPASADIRLPPTPKNLSAPKSVELMPPMDHITAVRTPSSIGTIPMSPMLMEVPTPSPSRPLTARSMSPMVLASNVAINSVPVGTPIVAPSPVVAVASQPKPKAPRKKRVKKDTTSVLAPVPVPAPVAAPVPIPKTMQSLPPPQTPQTIMAPIPVGTMQANQMQMPIQVPMPIGKPPGSQMQKQVVVSAPMPSMNGPQGQSMQQQPHVQHVHYQPQGGQMQMPQGRIVQQQRHQQPMQYQHQQHQTNQQLPQQYQQPNQTHHHMQYQQPQPQQQSATQQVQIQQGRIIQQQPQRQQSIQYQQQHQHQHQHPHSQHHQQQQQVQIQQQYQHQQQQQQQQPQQPQQPQQQQQQHHQHQMFIQQQQVQHPQQAQQQVPMQQGRVMQAQQQQQQQQQVQMQQQYQQHPQQQHQQQQIFAPQQVAGHSRPALTAMLHQKHAATVHSQRFNF